MPPKSRLSEAPSPKPPSQLASTCVISDSVTVNGRYLFTLGANSVIHPRCKINTANGPVTIGEYCIINERTNLSAPDHKGLTLENGVTIETNAVVEASRLGEGTTVEVGVKIGRGVVTGKNCKFTPLIRISEGKVLPDNAVVYGTGQMRIDASGSNVARRSVTEKHVEALRGLIPSNRGKFAT